MQSSLKSGLLVLVLIGGKAFALNPVEGLYAGIFLGGSYSPSINLSFPHPQTHTTTSGSLKYSPFGDIGGQLGYRVNQFRVEGELFYNSAPYDSITLGTTTFKSKKKSTGLRFKGQTSTAAFMVNGLYDAYFLSEQTNFVPYLGLGVGYTRVQNTLEFYCDNKPVVNNTVNLGPNNTCTLTPNPGAKKSNLSAHSNAPAAQVIIGASYFMDDFTTIGLDIRHYSTKSMPPFNTKVQSSSLNVFFNGAFDAG